MKKSFQEVLNDKMERLCLSEEFVAMVTGVSRATVQRWRAGSTRPYEAMQKIFIDKIQDMV